jgi:phosphatidylglycerophosphatase A
MASPGVAIALSMGLGLLPWAPGTFGAAGGFILYFAMSHLDWAWQAILTAGLFGLGCHACARAAAALKDEDHPAIVWDETVGMLIVLILTPASPLSWLVGFAAFRLLDIRKPWPVYLIDKQMRGGLAVMLDDAAAAIGAAGFVWAAHILLLRHLTG